MAHPFDAVLFDLGGVLVELGDPNDVFGWDGSVGRDDFWRRWLASPTVRRFDAGRIDTDTFAREIVAELELRLSPERFMENFRRWVKGPYPGALPLLQTLAPRYTLAYLSNVNALHWERLRGETALFEPFDAGFPSFELGRLKPDPEAYAYVLDALGVRAARAVFLDDNAPNVDGARAVGMHAYRVHEPKGAACKLRQLGVLPGRARGVE